MISVKLHCWLYDVKTALFLLFSPMGGYARTAYRSKNVPALPVCVCVCVHAVKNGQVSWQDCVQCQLLLEITQYGESSAFNSSYEVRT